MMDIKALAYGEKNILRHCAAISMPIPNWAAMR